MVRTLAVIERDMRKFKRNPVIMIMAVLMPIVYLVILGNSFQGKLKGLPVAVVNLDTGEYGRRVTETLTALQIGPETITVTRLADQTEAVEGVKDGLYKGAVIVPTDFTRRVNMKTGPEVGIFVDNTDQISENTLSGAITEAVGALRHDFNPVRPDRSVITARRVELYKSVDYDQTLVPGVVVMAIFMGTMITGVFNLVMDRFLGVDEAILMTPLTKADIVVGLVVSGFVITLAMAAIVLVASSWLTGLTLSNWLVQGTESMVVMALATLGLLSLMFLLMGRANHPRIMGVFSGFLNVIFFFPSGAVYPVQSFPGWLRKFALVNPEYYAVHALKSILFKAAPLSVVYGDILFLTGFTAVTMTLAVVTFKRTL